MSSLQRESKIYGAVESESYITFTGFCKRIYDTAQQSVDVFIDEEKVATLLANEKIRDIEEKYEVFDTNGFCFTYELPKKYIGQKHKLEFKTQEGKQLLHSPTHTIDKFSPLYNQAMFIESLHQPIQYHALENGYTKNALSFIAIEENLGDEAFIEFILEMSKKYKELSLSIFYFNEHQKNQATKIFNQIKNKNFINPSSVEEIIKNSEIYVHNVIEEFRFTINEEYYKKVKNIQAIKENLFMIELTRKAKKKKDMAEMVVDTVTPILFETSVVSQMFKEDERYNEFVFMNSLGQVNKEKIKDMYCPNSVGFIINDAIFEDNEFIQYLQELNIKFPELTFKAFYFTTRHKELFEETFQLQIDRLSFIHPIDIHTLASEIEFFFEVGAVSELFKFLIFNFKDILVLTYSASLKNKRLSDFSGERFKNNPVIIKSELFGISKEEIAMFDNNIVSLTFHKASEQAKISKVFDNNQNVYDLYYNDAIVHSLNNKLFKQSLIHSNRLVWEYNYGRL